MTVILVDIFDTVLLRLCEPSLIAEQWARCMLRKLPELRIGESDLLAARRDAFRSLRCDGSEPSYEDVMSRVFVSICQDGSVSDEVFTACSHAIDFSLECGCNVLNRPLVRKLVREKASGATVVAVSDFYLGKADIERLLGLYGVPEGLFDRLFVSVDVGNRKADGGLYGEVLEQLGVAAEDCHMYGDSLTSDYKMARSAGIRSSWLPHIAAKLRRLKKADARLLCRMAKVDYRRSDVPFLEYGLLYSIFCKRLKSQLQRDGAGHVAFMAREGFFLKELFEAYEELAVPESERIRASYYLCSRRSVLSGSLEEQMAENIGEDISINNWLASVGLGAGDAEQFVSLAGIDLDTPVDLSSSPVYCGLMASEGFRRLLEGRVAESRGLLLEYTDGFLDGTTFRFVDSGWRGTTQNVLASRYGYNTVGYYIGVRLPERPISQLDMRGLIFDERQPQSKRFGYLGSNIPFYQQLLAAPHGTTRSYARDAYGGVVPVQEWDPMEENLFGDLIEPHQQAMRPRFLGYSAWDCLEPYDDAQDKAMAQAVFRANLFLLGRRYDFARRCVSGYVQNFKQEKRGGVGYDYSKAHVGLDILWNPSKYINYYTKIQRTRLYSNPVIHALYPVLSHVVYGYVLVVDGIRGIFGKS